MINTGACFRIMLFQIVIKQVSKMEKKEFGFRIMLFQIVIKLNVQ